MSAFAPLLVAKRTLSAPNPSVAICAQNCGSSTTGGGGSLTCRPGPRQIVVLKLSHQQAEYEVRVNWCTGGVDIFAA
jgi:hypothetical protein